MQSTHTNSNTSVKPPKYRGFIRQTTKAQYIKVTLYALLASILVGGFTSVIIVTRSSSDPHTRADANADSTIVLASPEPIPASQVKELAVKPMPLEGTPSLPVVSLVKPKKNSVFQATASNNSTSPSIFTVRNMITGGLVILSAVAASFAKHAYGQHSIRHEMDVLDTKKKMLQQQLKDQEELHARSEQVYRTQAKAAEEEEKKQKKLLAHRQKAMNKHSKDSAKLQQDFVILTTQHRGKDQLVHHHAMNVFRLKTDIAAIRPRLEQEDLRLRVSFQLLQELTARKQNLDAQVCQLETKKKKQMIKQIFLAWMWEQESIKIKKNAPNKVWTVVKEIAINVLIDSAIDLFTHGGYIWNKVQKWTKGKLPVGPTMYLPSGPSTRTVVKKTIVPTASKTMADLVTVVKVATPHTKESLLNPIKNIAKSVIGWGLSTPEKVNHALVRRNTALRELASGWTKDEVTDFTRLMDKENFPQWATNNGYEDLYTNCRNLIESEIGA